MTLLNSQTVRDQDVPRAVLSPAATDSAVRANDDGFTQSVAATPYSQVDANHPIASSGKFTDQGNFVGSEHWEAILEDITELKIDLQTPDMSEIVDAKPQILFAINHATKSEILSSIPSRPIRDTLNDGQSPTHFTIMLVSE